MTPLSIDHNPIGSVWEGEHDKFVLLVLSVEPRSHFYEDDRIHALILDRGVWQGRKEIFYSLSVGGLRRHYARIA